MQKQHTIIVASLFGAHSFCYRAAHQCSAEILRARVHFVQTILDNVLQKIIANPNAAPAFYSRGSGRFIICSPTETLNVENIESCQDEINTWLLDGQKGQLVLQMAAEQIDEVNEGNVSFALGALRKKLLNAELEPCKTNLAKLFAQSPRRIAECVLCGREDLEIAPLALADGSYDACSLCHSVIEMSNGAVPATLPFSLPSAQGRLSTFRSLLESNSSNFLSALHIGVWSEGWKGLSSTTRPIADILLSECRNFNANHAKPGHRAKSFYIIEATDDNLVVLGELTALLELAFAFNDSIEREMPHLNHSTGIAHALHSLPLSWLIRNAVEISEQARQLGPRSLAVDFGGGFNASSGCFSWADWRGEVKPLVEKIRHFDHLGVLGYGFWDYLFDFSRSDSTSIYALMYKLARREESHSILRREPGWHQFKTDLLVSLSGSSGEKLHKRQLLKTALAWFLFAKRMQTNGGKERELILIERR